MTIKGIDGRRVISNLEQKIKETSRDELCKREASNASGSSKRTLEERLASLIDASDSADQSARSAHTRETEWADGTDVSAEREHTIASSVSSLCITPVVARPSSRRWSSYVTVCVTVSLTTSCSHLGAILHLL